MDLTPLFSPIDESIYSGVHSDSSFLKSINFFGKAFPDFKEAHIALIGINEMRGAGYSSGKDHSLDEIRKKLYNLKKGNYSYKIVDLGNLKLGIDLNESHRLLSEVCKLLISNNVLPLILGGSHDLDYAQFSSYEGLKKFIGIVNVDAFIDLESKHNVSLDRKHIHKIFGHTPNYLVSYSHLAYQSYLVDSSHIRTLEKLYFEAFRIGEIRNNLSKIEPSIRQADMLTFDLCAIRSADAPGGNRSQPFGLSCEEACQICWFAGLNEKLSSLGIYGYCSDYDDSQKKTASVVATMVWYFVEGFYSRKHETDFRSTDITKFIVVVEPESIIFYKSKFTDRWWMEVPVTNKSTYTRKSIIPCNYSDYQEATNGHIPDRYINALERG